VVRRVPDCKQQESIERAGVDELQSLQLKRLRATLGHSYANVAPFRKKCDTAGVQPDDLRSLADLPLFPFTVKEDLRQNYPYGMVAVPREDVVRVHASSGTTGKPTVVGYTKNDIDMWADVVARSMRAGGVERGDKVHNALGYGLFTGGLGFHYGAERLGAMIIPMATGQTPKQVQLIRDFKPEVIAVTPSYMLNIADEFERQGLHPADTSLEVGLFGGEPWSESMRGELESRLRMDAIDIYGLSEVIGPGVACEYIESKDGPTIWEDHFYPEVVDPDSGAPLPDGEMGELVFTSLTKEALPVVRYRTRDLSRLLPGSGRAMRRMEKVTGRSDDMLIIRGVNVFPTQIEQFVVKQPGLAPHYQLRVTRQGQLDELRVQVERSADASESEATTIGDALRKDIKAYVGINVSIEVCAPGQVARSEGKAVRVIDERQ
jgi:phenylacetate-CoA ligase